MRPPIIPNGTAVMETSETTDFACVARSRKRLSPSQIATAMPVIMHSA